MKKNVCLHDVDILLKILKDWALNKKYVTEEKSIQGFHIFFGEI